MLQSLKRGGFFSLFLVNLIIWSQVAGAGVILPPEQRVNIRQHMLTCETMIALPDTNTEGSLNDTVGVPLAASHNPAEFRAALEEGIKEKGKDFFVGSRVFILGVGMSQGRRGVAESFREVTRDLGFSERDIDIRVMTIPDKQFLKSTKLAAEALVKYVGDFAKLSDKVEGIPSPRSSGFWSHAKDAAQAVLQRVRYWMPSRIRDVQTPIPGEVITGITTTAAVEATNLVYLFKALPTLDAWCTVCAHMALLTILDVYGQTVGNWCGRPGTNRPELYAKQASFAGMFILNYNILGKLTPLLAFAGMYGWAAVGHAAPHAIINFLVTQGFLTYLQIEFYSTAMVQGLVKWRNSQVGFYNANLARVLMNLVRIPLLAPDALALALAANPKYNLFSTPVGAINYGHLIIGGLIGVGYLLKTHPTALNPVITAYKKFNQLRRAIIPINRERKLKALGKTLLTIKSDRTIQVNEKGHFVKVDLDRWGRQIPVDISPEALAGILDGSLDVQIDEDGRVIGTRPVVKASTDGIDSVNLPAMEGAAGGG